MGVYLSTNVSTVILSPSLLCDSQEFCKVISQALKSSKEFLRIYVIFSKVPASVHIKLFGTGVLHLNFSTPYI